MITLLDANVLIALLEADHQHHAAATRFFRTLGSPGWATCPLTENAVLRILGRPVQAGGLGDPGQVRTLLRAWCAAPGHHFWPDDLSLLDVRAFPNLPSAKNQTDFYLLALAVRHRGRLATFDRRMDATWWPGGPASYFLVPEE